METPNVVTEIHVGGFTLYAYAYRKLTKQECYLAVRRYMAQRKLRNLPASGSAKVVTSFGFDE